MNRMDSMTVRWVLIWIPMAGLFLGADYAIRAVVREIRRAREIQAQAAAIAEQEIQAAGYLRWLDSTWGDVSLDEILDGEGED